MSRTNLPRAGAFALALAAAMLAPGCGAPAVSEPASPVVTADSEAGQKARAEDERLRKERQEQEAKARRRAPGLPTEG